MARFTYPPAKREDLVEDFHGTPVADPYRWLEDVDQDEVQAWIAAQNSLTADYLAEISAREMIRQSLTRNYDMPRRGTPIRKGNRYFYTHNDGLQNQDVFYWREGLDGAEKLLLDPNTFSEDGTVAVFTISYTADGSLMAYATSESGSDWQQIHILRVDSGEKLPEVLDWCKFTNMAWLPDGSGFYYSRFPEQDSKESQSLSLNNAVYFHRVGTPQSEDTLVYERPDSPQLTFSPFITEDDEFLMIYVFEGSATSNRLYYRLLNEDGDFVRLLDAADSHYNLVGKLGNVLYIQTDLDAPKNRIIAIDTKEPARDNWQTVISESENPIAFATMADDLFVIAYSDKASHMLKTFNLDGEELREIPLPGIGALLGLFSRQKYAEVFLNFTSYLYPPTILRYDMKTGELSPWFAPKMSLSPEDFTTTRVWYTSKDGTQVSMYLNHRKDLVPDGQRPTLLYGYGGFNIPVMPGFAPHILSWMEMGGVYAVAHLRGGSEYGEDWHRAGMLGNKQNVFDDFIAAAEWLIAEGYTRKQKLAIMGRSNGGLLVSACMVQRPDLFGAVICGVPVADMLRFHRFTAGRYWTGEYGNAEENPEHFQFMYAYSPLHNVKAGQTYPPILVTTAERDDRVVPLHSMKFVAELQHQDSGENPLLLRLDTKSGHGMGKPVSKWIDEWADIFAFLHRELNFEAN